MSILNDPGIATKPWRRTGWEAILIGRLQKALMVRLIAGIAVAFTAVRLGGQALPPQQVRLTDVLPAVTRTTQLVLTPDARRVYYGDSSRAIWFYDRDTKRNLRLVPGEAFDLGLSPSGNALAYTRTANGSAEHHVWVLPLDPRTGLASGAERRASALEGDAPSISPDGKWLAFARDDSVGVAQSVVIVPLVGGRERTVVPFLRASVSNIRWSPDGKTLYFGVNPPVACDPGWSCLPLRDEFRQTTGSVRRVAVDGGAVGMVAAKVGAGWPGLSADGSLLAYSDTGFPMRVIVTDTGGHALHSFALPPRQTVEGWLNATTLVFSDRGDVRRLRSYSLVDGTSRLLVDSLEQLSEPAGSPDGQMISAVRCGPEGCELRIISADGTPRTVITLPDRYGGGNLWSPDGRWIAYVGGVPNGERHVNVVDVTMGRVAPLTAFRSTGATLLWLPDSRGMILSTVAGTGATRRVAFQRVDLDGQTRALRELVLGPSPLGGTAIDSRSAVLMRGGALARVSFDGDSSSETILLPPSDAHYSGIVMSPGRERLAVRRSRDKNSEELTFVEVVNPDGSDRVTIELPFQASPAANGLRFLPGGREFVVLAAPWLAERDLGAYLVTVGTKSVKRLFGLPPTFFTSELAMSPDGRTVLYVSSELVPPRVYTMDLSSLRAGRQ